MRAWEINIRFDNDTEHLFSVTLSDIAAFIKESTIKNEGVKKHTTLPIDSWLVDLVFDKAVEDYPNAIVIEATISQRG